MKVKTIIAVAALACASVASASTNYVELAAKRHNLGSVVRDMRCDTALTDAAAFRTALEAVDRSAADGETPFWGLTRCCPLAARAALHRSEDYAPKARADMIAVCGYDAENAGVALRPNERGYANFALQAACTGGIPVGWLRRDILSAAVVPARRTIRAEGGTFVGKTGGARVKAILDGLAAELNAPRFGNAGKLLAEIGIEVEWEFIKSRILGDAEIAALKAKLLGGEIPFDGTLQNKLCVALGVEGYNAFVREYNGNEGKRE